MSVRGPQIKSGKYGQAAAVIAVVTGVVAVFLLVFGFQAIERVRAAENHWATYSEDAEEADQILHDVSVRMGYGGFIHNLKNFILRRDPTYLLAIEEKAQALDADLRLLEAHVISGEEKAALTQIRIVFEKYLQAVERAQRAFERGLSSVEVDTLVKVDDAPALQAFAYLDYSFKQRADKAQAEIQRALEAASSMVLLLLIVVPVVILLGVLLVLFLRRIIVGNAKLEEVRDELAALLRQAPDAILHVAQDGAIIRVNDQAVSLFGYPRGEFVGMQVEKLVPEALRDGHELIRAQAFDSMRARPIGFGARLVALTKDGREVPVDISISFVVSGGKRIATAIVRDVTERKYAEEALQDAHDVLEKRVQSRTAQLLQRTRQLEAEMVERQRAENQLVQSAKMATIGEMASGITHELNQPMNIMRMGVEAALIRIQRGQADIGQLAETLRKVESQIVRMSDIINHMRAYSRLDTEGQAPFDPVRAVDDGCKLFAAQLQGEDIELIVNLPDSAAAVMGHATRLEQVILNLLSNARDAISAHHAHATAPNGVPNDARIRVTLRENAAQGNIVIEVEDSGGGVPVDVLPHIFAPFVTTKDSGHGTGLGLSISFGIIQSMNGTIDVFNGQYGARFTIQLPVASAAVREAPPEEARLFPHGQGGQAPFARPGGIAKVLVVDDEIGAAHSLSDFLQEMGYLVYTAYNGEEALQLYDSDPADVVITDLRMPVMGGAELTRGLRERAPGLPVFVMTGHNPDEGADAMPEGVREVWKKPLSLTSVAQRLQDMNGDRTTL